MVVRIAAARMIARWAMILSKVERVQHYDGL